MLKQSINFVWFNNFKKEKSGSGHILSYMFELWPLEEKKNQMAGYLTPTAYQDYFKKKGKNILTQDHESIRKFKISKFQKYS